MSSLKFYFNPRTLTLSQGTPSLLIKLIVPFDNSGWKAPIMELKMIVYDVEEYLADQRRRMREAGAGAAPSTFETDLSLFTGHEGTADFQPSRGLKVPAEVFALEPKKGNGVLATATLEIGRAEKESERKGLANGGNSAWFVNNVIEGDFVSHRSTPFEIAIKMMARSDKQGNFGRGTLQLRKIGSIGFNQDALQGFLEKTRHLAIRLVSTRDDQGPLKKRQIALSSLHKSENTTGGPLRSRKITVDVALAQAKLQGPGKATPVNTNAGSIPSRRKEPDLTGWYEQHIEGVGGIDPNSDAYLAPSALWLNQAGEALVGWYYPMAAIGLKREFLGEASKHIPLAERACFVTLASEQFPQEAAIYWFFSDKKDPTEIVARIREEGREPSITMREGRFAVSEHGSLITDVVLALTAARVLDDGSPPDPIGEIKLAKFRRVQSQSRIAWLSIEQLRRTNGIDPRIIDEVVRARVEPLPTGFWRKIARTLRDRMAAVVARFTQFPNDDEIVQQEFERAGTIVNDIVAFFPNEQYRFEALNWVRHFCNSIEFTNAVGSETKPLVEWLRDLSEKHLELEIKEREAERGVAELTPEERAKLAERVRNKNGGVLTDVGVVPANDFEYSFTFQSKSDTKRVGEPKNKKEKHASIGITGGIFECTIERRKIENGVPGNVEYTVKLDGAFAGIGAGFQIDFGTGKVSQPGASGPPGCKIRSFHDIEEDEWKRTFPRGIWFSMAAVATGISGNIGTVDIKTLNASSTLFSLTFLFNERDIHLSAILENAKLYEFKERDVGKVLEDLKKGNVAQAKATLFSISETFGFMTNLAFWKDKAPQERPVPLLREQDAPLDVLSDVQLVSFENGSAVILAEARLDFDRRLAVYRAMMEVAGWYWCQGFASPSWNAHPEQADQKNQALSEARAKAVDLLLEASLGGPGDGVVFADKLHIPPLGAGREPALTPVSEGGGGLHDPYDPATPKPVAIKEDWFDYPKWRRVDLLVNATLIARLKAP